MKGAPNGPQKNPRPSCKTCKHWEPGATPWGAQEGQEVGLCSAVDATELGGHKKTGMLAVAVGEAIYGELMTDAEFGCILHEVKSERDEEDTHAP